MVSSDDDRTADDNQTTDDDQETDTDQAEDDVEMKDADQVEDDQDKLKANPAWADAIAKVLKQKKAAGKKAIVLSKAKKIKDVKEKKPKLDFEIVGAEGDEKPEIEDEDEKKPIIGKKLMMKEYQTKGRVKPSVLDKDRERVLMKIATKGVVQLFNAVRQQQKTVEETLKKAGKSEVKREKMLEKIDKKQFLEVLTKSVKSVPVNGDVKQEEKMDDDEQTGSWSVLRDDFMMGTDLKDWDKKEGLV